MGKSSLDNAIEWIEKDRWLSDPTEADWQNCFSSIQTYLEQNPLDAKAHYVLAYGYFSKGENRKYPEIEKHLLRSLALDPNRPFPLFFLGMYYFNCGAYERSLSALSTIDLSFFTSINQSYRIAEVLEVRLCDRLYLNPSQVEISEVANFAKELIRLGKKDAEYWENDLRFAAVTPRSLTRCIDSLFLQADLEEKAQQMFEILIDLIQKLGQQEFVARVSERVRVRLASVTPLSGSSSNPVNLVNPVQKNSVNLVIP